MRTYLDIQHEAVIISVAQPAGRIENATKGDKGMTYVRNALKFPSSMIVSIDATSVLCTHVGCEGLTRERRSA